MKKRKDKKKESWIASVVRRGLRPESIGLDSEQAAKLVLANTLRDKRRRIRKAAAGTGENRPHNAQVKRFANAKARSLKKQLVETRRISKLNRSLLMRDRVPSPLLDGIDPDRRLQWKRIAARRYKSDFSRIELKNLNLLDHPIETIESLKALSRLEREELNAYLDFADQYCDDIGAYLVIAEIWHQLSPIFRGGRMSLPTQKVLDAVGLGRELNIRMAGVNDHKNIWPFEIRRRRTRGTTHSPTALLRPQDRELLNDQLIALIDEWLAVASENNPSIDEDVVWELTGEGKSSLANMVGEILDNAERHSSDDADGDWSMAAFMAKRSEPGRPDAMRCFLAFLSVGKSIAETIDAAPQEVKDFCNKYAALHSRAAQSRETLITVAALQDGVTSAHQAYKGGRGGTGLQEMLDMIGELGGHPDANCDARVTIVSGKSCIRLRAPNLVGAPDESGRRVQWCNTTNSVLYPPDTEIAFDLPAHFAGTLVSVAFTLDPGLFAHESDDDGHDDD